MFSAETDTATAIAVAQNADARLELFRIDPEGAVSHSWQIALNAGWSAWDASSNTKLSTFLLPSPIQTIGSSTDSPGANLEFVQPFSGSDPCADLRSASLMSIKLCDRASGRTVWLTTASDGASDRDFLIMQYGDGRVLVSEGAETWSNSSRGLTSVHFQISRIARPGPTNTAA